MEKAFSSTKVWSFALASSLFLFIFLHFSPVALAVPAAPVEMEFKQPDGVTFHARLKGDEWNNWTETGDGYALGKGEDDYWYYVSSYEGDKANLSQIRADQKPGSEIKWGIKPTQSSSAQEQGAAVAGGDSPLPSGTSMPFGSFNGKALMILGYYDNKPPTYGADSFSDLLAQLNNYYNTVSHGQVTMARAAESFGTNNDGVIGWLRLGAVHPNTGKHISAANQQITRDALIAANPNVNFSQYDTDGDGYVDSRELSIVVVVAGYEQSTGSSSPSVWGHAWCIGCNNSQVEVPQLDGKYVGGYRGGLGYAQLGEIHDNHVATIGIMAHELGHLTFGLPDLYDTADDGTAGYGLSNWCLMSLGSWGAKTGDAYIGMTPVVPNAWVRQQLGWDTPMTNGPSFSITAAGSTQANTTNSSLKVNTGMGTQYFLVDNRQDLGYDRGLEQWLGTGFGGLAIYHVDETQWGNWNESSRQVDLEPADNNESWDSQTIDTWRASPVLTQTSFNRGSAPNSNLNDGSPTDLTIKGISASGEVMTVSVVSQVVHVMGADGKIYYRYWNNSAWSAWAMVPGAITFSTHSAMAATSMSPGTQNLFAIDNNGNLENKYWSGSAWSAWVSLGSPSVGIASQSTISAASMSAGTLDVYVVGSDGNVYYRYWSGASWSAWVQLSAGLTRHFALASASMAVGTQNLFAIGNDGNAYNRYWTGSSWTPWISIGQPSGGFATNSTLAAVSMSPGTLDVYGVGTDGNVYYRYWTGSVWTPWSSISSGMTNHFALAAGSMQSGIQNIFAIGNDNNVSYRKWNGSAWTGWSSISAPSVGIASNSTLAAVTMVRGS